MFTSYKLVQKARRGSNSKGTHKSFLQARQRSNALNANMYCMYVYTYIILCIYIHIIYIMHAYNICIQKIYIYKYYIYNLPRLHFKSQFVSSQVARCQIWHQWSERLWWQRPRRPAERYRVNSSVLECVCMCSNSFQHSCNRVITSRVIFNLQSTWFDLSPYPNLLRRNTSRLSHTFAEHLSACNACALGWFHCKRCKRHHKYLGRRDIQDKKKMSLCLVENHLNQRRPFAGPGEWNPFATYRYVLSFDPF